VGRIQRSKGASLLALAALVACARDAQVTTRTVTTHAPAACAPGSGAYAIFQEMGDFEPATPATGHLLGDVGATLPGIDASARALLVKVTDSSDREWLGLGDVPPAGNVDVLLLPSLSACSFTTSVGQGAPASVGAVGGQVVLVVGGDRRGATQPPPFAVHLDTGEVTPASPGLLTPRIQATVTAFGGGGLVAGGMDPRPGGGVLAAAEVYVPAAGGFQQAPPIPLSQPRAGHGAAVLVTGETLLVGGVGADGRTVLDTMEVVDPVTRTVRAENVATLAFARRSPTVLQLASGEILVAGGLDGAGNTVPWIEWLSADASHATKSPAQLVAGSSARAYAALEAGGALAVIAPPAGAGPGFQSVWVIDADGALDPAAPLEFFGQPTLFGGAGGAPVLYLPPLYASPARWLRWQPYSGAFGVLGVDIPASVGDATASPDPGLALWIDPAAAVVAGLRFDAVGPYAPLGGPLLVSDTTDTAPDRLATGGAASFDPAVGLTLGPDASVFVTDRTYADVAIDVDAPTGQPALVVLRDELGDELEVGGASCPGALAARGPSSSLHVERAGASVAWSIAGGASGACPGGVGAAARLSVGVRAPASNASSVARNLRVTRLGRP